MATEAENEKQMTDKKPEPEKKGGFLSAIAKKVTETIGAKKKEEPPQPDEKENHQSGVKGVVQKVEEVGKKIVDKMHAEKWKFINPIDKTDDKIIHDMSKDTPNYFYHLTIYIYASNCLNVYHILVTHVIHGWDILQVL